MLTPRKAFSSYALGLFVVLVGSALAVEARAVEPGDADGKKEYSSLLEFVNAAKVPADLQYCVEIKYDTAAAIFESREAQGLGGYKSADVLEKDLFAIDKTGVLLKKLCACYGCCGTTPTSVGQWTLLPYSTQNPAGGAANTAHASLLPTGNVLFFREADSTEVLIWDPTDQVNPQFSYPDNFPTDYLWCSHHVFLTNGELLTVGGGGNSSGNAIDSAWRFDAFGGPNGNGWWTPAASMANTRWYPTAVQLGGRVMVAAGLSAGAVHRSEVEVYDEASDTWTTLTGPVGNPTGADRVFPETYPSLHLLPTGEIFFSRTGWHYSNTPGTAAAYFQFYTSTTGEWIDMTTSLTYPDRTEGMGVQLLTRNPLSPVEYDSTIMVIAGGTPNASGQDTAESIDVSNLTPSTAWNTPTALLEDRLHAHSVLLPDGTVLTFGGNTALTSEIYDPVADTWTQQGNLSFTHQYHSTGLLLPSGQVMVTGGSTNAMEIFDPPYLFNGPRPTISSAPAVAHHSGAFPVTTPQAAQIRKVVLVRPMSVTHQMDSEQRVLELDFTRTGTTLNVTAPAGAHPHAQAPRGNYLLFILNCNGVPSVGRFINLH